IYIYVSPQDFNRLDQESELYRRRIRFRRYNAKERFLIVVILGTPHERLHVQLYQEYTRQIDRMGLEDAWGSDGATTWRPGGNRGEGDSSGRPRPRPNGRSWPTLIIEAGDLSSLEKLREDIRWWFLESEHYVRNYYRLDRQYTGRDSSIACCH
ncbi:hypothetical protein B0H67DRAFT_491034, partial [Lasiosphaeris hirsuta]